MIAKKSLEELDLLIKKGQVQEAWQSIRLIKPSEVPRESLLDLAELARRARQPLFSLKILGRIVKNHREKIEKAQPMEIIAYVGSLIKLGFLNEADQWLKLIPEKKYPQYYDLKARIQIAQWNYPTAVFYLKKYINNTDPESYFHLVGLLNLSSALLSSGLEKQAIKSIKKIQTSARKMGHKLILGNSFELMAQAQIQMNEFDNARISLKKGQSQFSGQESIWSFYARKWDLVIDLRSSTPSHETLQKGESLLLEAQNKSYWEGSREIERLLCNAEYNQERLLKLYFGTTYENYRTKIIKNFPEKIVIPNSYVCTFLGGTSESLFNYEEFLATQVTCLNLFQALTKDLYRPLPLGYVFSALYGDEYFDPFHSPGRVYAVVKRLRALLPVELGLKICWDQNGIRLKFTKPIALTLYRSLHRRNKKDDRVVDLRSHFKKKWFSSKQVRDYLNVSESSTLRCLREAQKKYKIETAGNGRSLRYRFK